MNFSKSNLLELIKITTKRYPELGQFLHGRAAKIYCEVKQVERDVNEPMREQKIKTETKLKNAIMRRFRRQFRDVLEGLRANYKDIFAPGIYSSDNPDELNELVIIFRNSILAAILDMEAELGYSLGETAANEMALKYAREYVTDWLSKLDETSIAALREALSLMPSGQASYADVVAALEPVFGAERALRIAVTETTRIYAEAAQLYAQELRREYPGFRVKKRWFTNVDDRVCPICAPLDGMEVDEDKDFDGISNPPAHVNCRCWISVTVRA